LQYRAHRAKVAAASAKDREAVEKKSLEQVEKDGLKAERIAALGRTVGETKLD
jgi:methylsterol monooxygenase